MEEGKSTVDKHVMVLLGIRVARAFALTNDYFGFISEEDLALRIPNVPSNSLGQQAWCILGARESYLQALRVGAWQGFSCSLRDHLAQNLILSKLADTTLALNELLQEPREANLNLELLLDLLEHEVQHHGQLVRYSYANRLGFPTSWTERYTV